jgi:hypothetical protein
MSAPRSWEILYGRLSTRHRASPAEGALVVPSPTDPPAPRGPGAVLSSTVSLSVQPIPNDEPKCRAGWPLAFRSESEPTAWLAPGSAVSPADFRRASIGSASWRRNLEQSSGELFALIALDQPECGQGRKVI